MEFELQSILIDEQDFNSVPEDSEVSDLLAIYLDQAKSDYKLLNFRSALKALQKVAKKSRPRPDRSLYVDSLVLMVRIFLEQENKDELLKTAMQLRELQDESDLSTSLRSKISYTLGILSYREENGKEKSLLHFERAIELSLKCNDREGLAQAIYGVANVFYGQNEYQRALLELDKMDQILMFFSVPDLKVSSLLLRSFIKRNLGETAEALKLARSACAELSENPNIYLYLQALYSIGSTYLKVKDYMSAQIYLELAKVSCPSDQLPRIYGVLIKSLNQCRTDGFSSAAGEVFFDRATGVLKRKGVGSISLQGQFILRDLLSLFFENPGKAFSKEELVEKVWKEAYSPLEHDNKIYVTLKRLRQALNPLFKDESPITRTKDGYIFNQ